MKTILFILFLIICADRTFGICKDGFDKISEFVGFLIATGIFVWAVSVIAKAIY